MTLTIGSLFSGIGGLELGLERAGLGPVIWQVEKEPYARAVLAKHWPDATRYEDVKDVGRANLVPVDVICGGFPCQDISYAGKGAGLEGERSGLWYEFARIVRELGPRYVVVENVAALLGPQRGMGAVLGTLSDCGYDVEWSSLQAADVGAPHWRDRVFLVAHAGCRSVRGERGPRQDECAALQVAREAQERERVWAESRGGGADVPNPRRERSASGLAGSHEGQEGLAGISLDDRAERSRTHDGARPDEWWAVEPNVGRVAHGVPARMDRLRALGNAVVPQVAEVVGQVVLALEAERLASEAA